LSIRERWSSVTTGKGDGFEPPGGLPGGIEGSRGIRFIELIEFLGFIGLMKRKRVEGSIPTAISNTINPKNTMNKATNFIGLEGGLQPIAKGT
jgi:hypothetical protein